MTLIKRLKPVGYLLLHLTIGWTLAYIAIMLIAIFGAGFDGTEQELQAEQMWGMGVQISFYLYQAWSLYRYGWQGIVQPLIRRR